MKDELVTATKLLSVLAHMQRWEAMNLSIAASASGRQLYFGLIRHLNNGEQGLTIDSMKEIYYDDGIKLTERGLRLAIRAFEADGVLTIEKASVDKRSRRIFLTSKFQEQMLAQAEVMTKALNENFLVLTK